MAPLLGLRLGGGDPYDPAGRSNRGGCSVASRAGDDFVLRKVRIRGGDNPGGETRSSPSVMSAGHASCKDWQFIAFVSHSYSGGGSRNIWRAGSYQGFPALEFSTQPVLIFMAGSAKGNQVQFLIIAVLAARLLVMDM
jgi:hypothetical protein